MKIYAHLRLALIATTFFLSATTFAQNRHQPTEAAPREGFWVVESQPRKACVVYFYNNDKQLIYQETLTQKRLNLKRATTRASLNTVLEQALRQWALNPQPGNGPLSANQRWLAAEFSH